MIEGLLLQQFGRQAIEDGSVVHEDCPRLGVSAINKVADFGVYRLSHGIGVVTLVTHVTPQEHFTTCLTELHRANVGTHAVFGHHPTSNSGRLLNVVRCARGGVMEDNFFGDTTTHGVGELVE